jgi:hypothetical protein
MTRRTRLGVWSVLLLVAGAFTGCGQESSGDSAEAKASAPQGSSPSQPAPALATLPTASITSSAGDLHEPAASESNAVETEELPPIPFSREGTPEWRLYEITRLMAPPALQKEVVRADGETEIVERTPQEITVDRKAALQQVVGHAGQVIAATHADSEQESLFTNAVHYLCTAHVELAILGEADSARQLGEVSEAIYREKPESAAAVESAAKLVELARRMAELYGASDAEWIRAHVTQARLFSERFPKAESQASMALLAAGRNAEQRGLAEEARQCYTLLEQKYPGTPFAEEIAGVLRRMKLPGRVLQAGDLGGATIDGGYVSVEQLRGKHVLVVFWTTDSPTFESDLPVIKQIKQTQGDNLVVLGVNLDQDELAVDRFLEQHAMGWRQIIDPNPELRGSRNPVASYYGVATVPLYWLIDPSGKVIAAPADIRNLGL